jgi:hypothetical protein
MFDKYRSDVVDLWLRKRNVELNSDYGFCSGIELLLPIQDNFVRFTHFIISKICSIKLATKKKKLKKKQFYLEGK